MKLATLEITLPDDLSAFVRSEVERGRFGSDSEIAAAAVYHRAQELSAAGHSSPTIKAVLARPLADILAELRQLLVGMDDR